MGRERAALSVALAATRARSLSISRSPMVGQAARSTSWYPAAPVVGILGLRSHPGWMMVGDDCSTGISHRERRGARRSELVPRRSYPADPGMRMNAPDPQPGPRVATRYSKPTQGTLSRWVTWRYGTKGPRGSVHPGTAPAQSPSEGIREPASGGCREYHRGPRRRDRGNHQRTRQLDQPARPRHWPWALMAHLPAAAARRTTPTYPTSSGTTGSGSSRTASTTSRRSHRSSS